MDVLLICRDALASSLVANLLMAIEAKKTGLDAGVLFTGENVAALAGGGWSWPRELAGQEMRLRMADEAENMGIPTMGGKGEGRQIDIRRLLEKARETGVQLFACAAWAQLSGISGKLPVGVAEINPDLALKMIMEAQVVLGSF